MRFGRRRKEVEKIDGLSDPEIRRHIMELAWPCVIELFLLSLLNVVNMVMVGHISPQAINAVGITNQPVLVGMIFFQAFNVGGTALVARSIGAGDPDYARRVSVQVMELSAAAGFVLAMLMFAFARPIVHVMGAQADYIDDATLYMQFASIGVFVQAIPTAASALMRGVGNTKLPMQFNIVSNIINAVLGYLLIFGPGFLPSLGVAGAAWAQLLGKLGACGMSLYVLYHDQNLPIALSLKVSYKPDMTILKRVSRIGLATSGEQVVMRVGVTIFTKMIADLGTEPYAAHNIALNLLGFTFNYGQAISIAATTLTGRSLGEKKPDLAVRYVTQCRKIGFWGSLILIGLFTLLPYQLARMYTSDTNVIKYTVMCLYIVSVMIPGQTQQLVIAGALRGAGDTVWPLMATIAGVLGMRLVIGYLLIEAMGLGLMGAWISFVLDQYMRSLVILLRFKSGKWKLKRV